MEGALTAVVTTMETGSGHTLEGHYSSIAEKLSVLTQLLVRQSRIPKRTAARIMHCVTCHQMHRMVPDRDMKDLMATLRRQLGAAKTKTGQCFEIKMDEFPELCAAKPGADDEMPPLALPAPALSSMQWFRDSTGMVHFGVSPPPGISIEATGYVH